MQETPQCFRRDAGSALTESCSREFQSRPVLVHRADLVIDQSLLQSRLPHGIAVEPWFEPGLRPTDPGGGAGRKLSGEQAGNRLDFCRQVHEGNRQFRRRCDALREPDGGRTLQQQAAEAGRCAQQGHRPQRALRGHDAELALQWRAGVVRVRRSRGRPTAGHGESPRTRSRAEALLPHRAGIPKAGGP